jgi:hypothetical protein
MTTSSAPAGTGLRKTLLFIALICSGLVFGLTLTHVLQDPGSRGLSGTEWLQVQHTFYGGFAVVGGIGEIGGLITCGVLGTLLMVRHNIAGAVRSIVAAVCLLGTLLSYFFGNRPVNTLIAGWTPGTLPPDWTAYRDMWETAHAISAVLSAVAFVLLAVSAVWGKHQIIAPASSTPPARESTGVSSLD